MKQRRHEIDIHKDMLKAQIKSSEEERQTVRYSNPAALPSHSSILRRRFGSSRNVEREASVCDLSNHRHNLLLLLDCCHFIFSPVLIASVGKRKLTITTVIVNVVMMTSKRRFFIICSGTLPHDHLVITASLLCPSETPVLFLLRKSR